MSDRFDTSEFLTLAVLVSKDMTLLRTHKTAIITLNSNMLKVRIQC